MIKAVVGVLALAVCVVLLGIITARVTREFLEDGIAERLYQLFCGEEDDGT